MTKALILVAIRRGRKEPKVHGVQKMKIAVCETSDRDVHPEWEWRLRKILEQGGYDGVLEINAADSWVSQCLNEYDGNSCLQGHINDARMSKAQSQHRLFYPGLNPDFRHFFKKHLLHAKYGMAFPGFFAVEYAPPGDQLSTQLHETLHLFEVDECYDPDTKAAKPSCTNPECLMLYGKPTTVVCDNVLEQLRSFILKEWG